jgi:poly(3-hydroxybutyrate) depolymerase
MWSRLALAAGLAAAAPAFAADLDALPALNAAIADSSVSGLSSGAFMAVQFGTAWSSTIRGVGVVSGGPFWCAQASASTATGPCMEGPPPPLDVSTGLADRKAASGDIDPTDNLARQQIYLFHGYNDSVVARAVTDATAAFYDHYLGDRHNGHLFYQTALGAGHAFVVPDTADAAGLNDCPASRRPYIDRCGYDQAGIILRHIYGALDPPSRPEALSGTVKSFDQASYAKPDTPGSLSLGREGFVFVPKDCEAATGPACRVHIVLHGCEQNAGTIDRTLVDKAGFNAWADTNRIIVLYPQTTARPLPLPFQPLNPFACWDWWGYVHADDSYVTKSGRQITAIKAMLDALTAGYRPAAATPTMPGTAPAALVVSDTSDTAAALAWSPVEGATGYTVSRAGADGSFAVVGHIAAPSFADTGLAPQSPYRWRVTAIVHGTEGPGSPEATATTRAAPPRCEHPGHCPLAAPPR